MHYALDVDRQGAKNPSLGTSSVTDSSSGEDQQDMTVEDDVDDRSFEERVKRARELMDAAEKVLDAQLDDMFAEDQLSAAASPNSLSSSLSSYMAPQVKRRFTGAALRKEIADDEDEDDDSEHDEYDLPVPHKPMAPLAVRPIRPMAVRPGRAGLPPSTTQEDNAVEQAPLQQQPRFIDAVPQDITALRESGSVSPMSCSPNDSSVSSSLNQMPPQNGGGLMTVLPNEAVQPA
ncbi:MAG: hypothetical protein SGARI_004072, partial [Bacillariaceae sp.]